MAAAPTGTVALLFTDIEGSTALAQDLGIERYERVLRDHARIIRHAIAANDGYEARTEGDSFFVVFRTARQATAAAAEIQRGISTHEWPFGVAVRVRVGIHAGEAAPASAEAGTDYVGYAVHVAARVSAAAHAGQILLTETVSSLLEGTLPLGTSIRDLGDHRLKDTGVIRIHQLTVDGLQSEFPPLRSSGLRPNNLPARTTALIARERELESLRSTLLRPEVRLVTLTGPGGTGKTLLALEAAARLLDQFEDGVFLVRLASVTDPDLVALTIARAVGVREASGQPIVASLIKKLGDAEQLIVLDNFEQVLAAAPLASELLASCPRLKLLVTSRAALGLSVERMLPLDPLPVPDPAVVPTGDLAGYGSVALFIERARGLQPDLQPSAEDVATIARICARLDGLPLAIELAAARIRTLSLHEIASRLESRLALLTGGPRDMPERQRTLRDTIAWSADLLAAEERLLFSRLSVFGSSWTIAAAEAICGRDLSAAVLDHLESLLRQNLIRRLEGKGHARFGMLETVREYAEGMLAASDEAQAIRDAHSDHYVHLAEALEPRFETAELVEAMHELEAEQDEIRAVLDRAIGAQDADRASRIVGALAFAWWIRGQLTEGRFLVEQVLALPGVEVRDGRRAKVLLGAGLIAMWQREPVRARTWIEEALAIWRDRGEDRRVCDALHFLGDTYLSVGDPRGADPYYQEGIRLARAVGREFTTLALRFHVGTNLIFTGQVAEARALFDEIQPAADRLGNQWLRSLVSYALALTLLLQGDALAAQRLLQRAVALARDIGDRSSLAVTLLVFSGTRAALGDAPSALRLLGVADAELERTGFGVPAIFRTTARTPTVDPGDGEAARAYAEGRAMRIEEAVAYALSLAEVAGVPRAREGTA